MKIRMNATCLKCHFNKNLETALSLGDEATAFAFGKDLMRLYLSAPDDVSSPWFGPGVTALFQKYYGLGEDRYVEEKQLSNAYVLQRMDAIRSRVESQADPVYAGLQFSILGNYLDFSALQGKVSFDELDRMLDLGFTMDVEKGCYKKLCHDLETGKRLLFLTDNAGEIGFDRIFAEQIAAKYPQLEITFCVRGGPVLNDATREDALAVGVPFPVIDNGNCIGGTDLQQLSSQAKAALEQADVIIAKGMGNVETAYGCGYNLYYAFLIKCQMFADRFQKPMMTPMLVRELDG
ncbi:MAG: DUF89 family protein [Ruminococcaceae bacterium]|nr:DUF89 family protein [Oscillospiraceae bacterium]